MTNELGYTPQSGSRGKSVMKLKLPVCCPPAIVLDPSDREGVELPLSTTNAVEHMSLPYDDRHGACLVCRL
jgi:hypothetical protein